MAEYSKYDKVAAQTLRSLSRPQGIKFTLDVVEHPTYTELRVYKNEILAFGPNQQLAIMEYLAKAKAALETLNLRIWVGGAHGDPPVQKRVRS